MAVNPLARVYLQLNANFDTICSGQEVTFTASPVDYLTYRFYVNDVLVQNSGANHYTGSGYVDGDRIHVKVTDNNGCTELFSDTVSLTVLPTPVITLASSDPNDTVCIGSAVTFTANPAGYDEYTFFRSNEEVQSGTSNAYAVPDLEDREPVYVMATQDGCVSNMSNLIRTKVTDPLPAPVVNCGAATDSSLVFLWDDVPGAASFQVSVDGGAYAAPSSGSGGLFHKVTGLGEGDTVRLRVRASDGGACGFGLVSAQQTCVAQDCDETGFEAPGDVVVCEGDQVSLAISNIRAADFSITWNNGTPGRDSSYAFAAVNSLTIPVVLTDSTQLHCADFVGQIRVEVIPRPVVSLSSDKGTQICAGEGFTMTASPGSYDNYIFFNNSSILQDGPLNTYTEKQPWHGHYYFVLASDGDCMESSDSLFITVLQPLAVPVVNVESSTTSSITFSWNPVSGASGYMVSINDGIFQIPSSGLGGTTHVVSGLSPGEAATAVIMALGSGACGNSELSQPAYGFAENCSPIGFSLDTDFAICEGDSVFLHVKSITLDHFTLTWGLEAPGTVTTRWVKPPSDTTIQLVVRNTDEPVCPGKIALVQIAVDQVPAKLTVTSSDPNDSICETQTLKFTATPTGYGLYQFYNEYMLVQQSISNTYSTSQWESGQGLKVRARNGGCTGPFSDPIHTFVQDKLATPEVNCGKTTDTSIVFKWDPVADAEGYQVRVNGASLELPSSGATGLTHLLEGLTGGDPATIQVLATGSGPCGNSVISDTITCRAVNCDDYDFAFTPADTMCEGESLTLSISAITLSNYVVSWNGGTPGPATSYTYFGVEDSTITVSVSDPTQPVCRPLTRKIRVTVNPLPLVDLYSTTVGDSLCEGEFVEFFAEPASWATYNFYNHSTLVQSSGNPVLAFDTAINDLDMFVETTHKGCTSVSNAIRTTVLNLPR
ncbi:MAG: hypothetical protein R2751_10465 [Bacteroidales bacterium]